jgi:protein-L-isoaspartate(D-aspartate) O-methyltransferase
MKRHETRPWPSDQTRWRRLAALLVLLVVLPASCTQPPPPAELPFEFGTIPPKPYSEPRARMVADQIERRGVVDPAVLAAMRAVPRHRFVPDEYISQAYADHPLPIGHGQTISQPYIVALMTEALQIEPGQRVLEIGAGSGYQAAILAEMGVKTYTVEIIPELTERARMALAEVGYGDVQVRQADGYFGWEEHAPFDAIIVTAAPDHLPQPLANQLADGGRMVIPIGPSGAVQTLWLFEKIDGELQATNLGAVRFVPFTGAGRQ